MNQKENKLEVGDVIYGVDRVSINSKFTVERVTKTQAICKASNGSNQKFQIYVYGSGSVRQIGSYSWSTTSYYVATEVLDKRFKRESLIRKLSTIEWSKIPDESIEKINSILSETL